MKILATFVRELWKSTNLTQEEFAERAGVALTVVRKIEQGKTNLNMDSVNQVLRMFGHELGPVNSREVERWDKPMYITTTIWRASLQKPMMVNTGFNTELFDLPIDSTLCYWFDKYATQ